MRVNVHYCIVYARFAWNAITLIYVRPPRDYRAGYKITVIDKSEKDWWKGKCLGGRVGYFPSAYVMRVESGQRTLQVTRNLQLADQTLLRDQVLICIARNDFIFTRRIIVLITELVGHVNILFIYF